MANNLDKELADAAGLGRAEQDANGSSAADDGTMTVPERPQQRAGVAAGQNDWRLRVALLAMVLVMAAGIVALFMFGFEGAAVYSMPLDKLLATPAAKNGRRVRIEGELVPGTLRKRDKPCEYRFDVRSGDKKVKVEIRYPQCIVPDTFRDVPEGGVMVTAEGALSESGQFEATQIMAKCSSKYNPETHQMGDLTVVPTPE